MVVINSQNMNTSTFAGRSPPLFHTHSLSLSPSLTHTYARTHTPNFVSSHRFFASPHGEYLRNTGPGAGRYPTANSVCNDLIRISQGRTLAPFPLDHDVPLFNDYSAQFYVRISITDGLGIIKQVGEAAEAEGVSIHSILQNPITAAQVDFVVTTETVRLTQVRAFSERVAKMSFSLKKPLFMPML